MNNNSQFAFTNTLSGDDSCCSDTDCCPSQGTIKRETPKVGRNDPCPCGSQVKFKKCCGKST